METTHDQSQVSQPEILLEEYKDGERDWLEKPMYYTGAGYIAGALGGGIKGVIEGVKAAESGESLKIRTSRVLSSCGCNGGRYGNGLGAMGVLFAATESLADNITGADYNVNSIFAGMSTGVIYNAVNGSRPVAFAAVAGALAGGVFAVGKKVVDKFVDLPV